MRIQNRKVIEKVLKKGRWYAILDQSFNGRKTMPHAHYVWLLGNPCFEEIPKGYVIHHLDYDEQNDDISNLVIMQKHHHSAHHWKQKIITPKIRVDLNSRLHFYPINKPSIHKRKDQDSKFIVCFVEYIGGIKKQVRVQKHNGQSFTSLKIAEKFRDNVWKDPYVE